MVTEAALEAAAEASGGALWGELQGISVFARMKPQGKAKVIRALQERNGSRVLMCGDGGNDVGALKQADVGLALLAGYGDANTTDKGGYAAAGEKLARAGGSASAESNLNAQAEALQDAQQNSVEIRKKKLAEKQKVLICVEIKSSIRLQCARMRPF